MVLIDILEDNGNDVEIKDYIHTVDDYGEDENDDYDDNESSSRFLHLDLK